MSQSKYQKTCSNGDIYFTQPVDRISALPNKVLYNILVNLSTEGAVSTSILSQRWKYVWIGLPVLNFTNFPLSTTENPFNKQQYVCYKNFINRVLFLSNVDCLERVHLECHIGFSPSNVSEWIFILAKRCVKELCLAINLCSTIKLAPRLLQSDELVVLKLEDACDPFTSFLSGCPVLEELNIDMCEGIDEFLVCSSSLKALRIVSKARLEVSTSTVRWVKLLQRFQCLQRLTLHRIILDGFNLVNQLPIFCNLTNLQFDIPFNCIFLVVFDWPEIMPRSKEFALERVEFLYFDIDQGHLEIMRFFLSNSKLLKELKIHIQHWVSPVTEIHVLKRLLDLPRASTMCQIAIVSRDDDNMSEDTGSESDYTSG
ncbi:putative F-box/LRR-repeat protein At4g15060 [Silene latifolia]|uniref:putative F-box/LRR-repeat protein At4g15060 n=1 Tax=Silene latifolia TaxID=37657 RepID=UPI003D772849